MKRWGPGRWIALAWAILAVALQGDAVVISTVMSLEAPTPICGLRTTGLDGPAHQIPGSGRDGSAGPCAFCAAADHAPTFTQPLSVPTSTQIAYAVFQPIADHSDRPVSPIRPRARGPPVLPA